MGKIFLVVILLSLAFGIWREIVQARKLGLKSLNGMGAAFMLGPFLLFLAAFLAWECTAGWKLVSVVPTIFGLTATWAAFDLSFAKDSPEIQQELRDRHYRGQK